MSLCVCVRAFGLISLSYIHRMLIKEFGWIHCCPQIKNKNLKPHSTDALRDIGSATDYTHIHTYSSLMFLFLFYSFRLIYCPLLITSIKVYFHLLHRTKTRQNTRISRIKTNHYDLRRFLQIIFKYLQFFPLKMPFLRRFICLSLFHPVLLIVKSIFFEFVLLVRHYSCYNSFMVNDCN